ncbi:MAG: HAD family phosphatase [Caldilineaceae bacterium]
MREQPEITTLFLDIGGVLLTNGWGHESRRAAAERFNLDYAEMNDRHHLTFDTYEEGKLSLDDYLSRLVFCEPRPFARDEFKRFMWAQSRPYPDMLDFIPRLKAAHKLKVVVVSNEGRELTVYRIATFKLDTFVDCFVSSCFVHMRKPDLDIYRLALDVVQAPPEQVVYLDDRAMLVQVATSLGIHGIHHTDYATTRQALAELGLVLNQE